MGKRPLPRSILVVDDNESDCEVIRRFLSDGDSAGPYVAFAPTMAQGVALARAASFELALVDTRLPDGPGKNFGRHLDAAGVTLPFVLLTGHERPKRALVLHPHEAVDFIPKNELSTQLLARVCDHAIARERLRRELREARRSEETAAKLEREARAKAERALADQALLYGRVSRLYLLSSVFSAALTTDEVALELVGHASVFGKPSGASFYEVRDQSLVLLHAAGFEDIELAPELPLSANTPLTEAARCGELARGPHVTELGSPRERAAARVTPPPEWLAAPLRNESRVLGVIGLRFERGDEPLGEEIAFVRLVAELAAQAIDRARLYEEAARRADFERRLLAIVGHDLRGSLSVITISAQVLERDNPGEPTLARLLRGAKRMSDLIEDVMRRSEQFCEGGDEDAPTALEVGAVVQEAMQEVRAAFPGREVRVVGLTPLRIQGNATRLRQVIGNLLRNGVQHGEPGRPVTITFGADDREVTLVVHNHGTPIPAEALPTLFDPFRRGAQAKGRGSGLGLFIVYELSTAMGGRVDVESGWNGTTFTVRLPREPRPVSERFRSTPAPPAPLAPPTSGS